MVKLDAGVLRYMGRDEFRVLTAVEMGMKNHDVVPTSLICRIAGLRSGGAQKVIGLLHKNKLIYHDAKRYDGYRLTYQGYDFLAIKAFVTRGHISAFGRRIGVGKESDIYECFDEEGTRMVMKIVRLGRTSFKTIKNKRDYLQKRSSASWLYLARIAALREFAYMKALYEHDFVVPTPIDWNRHCILMSLVDAYPCFQIREMANPADVYSALMNLIVRLAEHGLIHCDFNEFNLLIDEDEHVTLIDFPQMISTSHENAKFYFDRDVECVRRWFRKRFKFECDDYPVFNGNTERKINLDTQLKASGVESKELEEFEKIMRLARNEGGDDSDGEAPLLGDEADAFSSDEEEEEEEEEEVTVDQKEADEEEEEEEEEEEDEDSGEDSGDEEEDEDGQTKKTKKAKKKGPVTEDGVRRKLKRHQKKKRFGAQAVNARRNTVKNRDRRKLNNEVKASLQ